MTYIGSSDVPSPYGFPWISNETAQQRGIPPLDLSYDKEDVLRRKTVKGAVWMVSRCKAASGRERAVAALSESNFRVDIGGKCARNISMQKLCPRNNNCDKLFGQYYFYIAAENSICIDYITEKYWERFHYPSVPIVMRRYIYEGHLPPKSFIAMDDYESPTAMAQHLNYLMDNPEEYMSYFAWRQQGLTRIKHPRRWIGMCNLCARLLRGDYDRDDKRIPDFKLWYESQSKCEDDSFAVAWSGRIRQ
ncbi:alpha1,3-fucosyltransferase [Aphelenchoides avenae]|nr:alpha1,3-fucosyltransferase [Aphelenchus avenae]